MVTGAAGAGTVRSVVAPAPQHWAFLRQKHACCIGTGSNRGIILKDFTAQSPEHLNEIQMLSNATRMFLSKECPYCSERHLYRAHRPSACGTCHHPHLPAEFIGSAGTKKGITL